VAPHSVIMGCRSHWLAAVSYIFCWIGPVIGAIAWEKDEPGEQTSGG